MRVKRTMEFAGASSAALKKVHLKRLMAVAVALILCTLVSWELMIVCWAVTPYMPVRGSGVLGDFLSILVSKLGWCAFHAARLRSCGGKSSAIDLEHKMGDQLFFLNSLLWKLSPPLALSLAPPLSITCCVYPL